MQAGPSWVGRQYWLCRLIGLRILGEILGRLRGQLSAVPGVLVCCSGDELTAGFGTCAPGETESLGSEVEPVHQHLLNILFSDLIASGDKVADSRNVLADKLRALFQRVRNASPNFGLKDSGRESEGGSRPSSRDDGRTSDGMDPLLCALVRLSQHREPDVIAAVAQHLHAQMDARNDMPFFAIEILGEVSLPGDRGAIAIAALLNILDRVAKCDNFLSLNGRDKDRFALNRFLDAVPEALKKLVPKGHKHAIRKILDIIEAFPGARKRNRNIFSILGHVTGDADLQDVVPVLLKIVRNVEEDCEFRRFAFDVLAKLLPGHAVCVVGDDQPLTLHRLALENLSHDHEGTLMHTPTGYFDASGFSIQRSVSQVQYQADAFRSQALQALVSAYDGDEDPSIRESIFNVLLEYAVSKRYCFLTLDKVGVFL